MRSMIYEWIYIYIPLYVYIYINDTWRAIYVCIFIYLCIFTYFSFLYFICFIVGSCRSSSCWFSDSLKHLPSCWCNLRSYYRLMLYAIWGLSAPSPLQRLETKWLRGILSPHNWFVFNNAQSSTICGMNLVQIKMSTTLAPANLSKLVIERATERTRLDTPRNAH